MARRPSLTEAGIARPASSLPVAERPQSAADAKRAPARQGKKAIAFWVDPQAAIQLRVAAASMDRTLQDIMTEALDGWFRTHGLHRLAGKDAA